LLSARTAGGTLLAGRTERELREIFQGFEDFHFWKTDLKYFPFPGSGTSSSASGASSCK